MNNLLPQLGEHVYINGLDDQTLLIIGIKSGHGFGAAIAYFDDGSCWLYDDCFLTGASIVKRILKNYGA